MAKFTIAQWDEIALAMGTEKATKLLGARPELTVTAYVDTLSSEDALAVMVHAVECYKDFKNPLRSSIDYPLGMAKKHWVIKGKQKKAVEGEVFARTWEIAPAPTMAELEATWSAACNASKCAYYRAYKKSTITMPMTDRLTPVAPLDNK